MKKPASKPAATAASPFASAAAPSKPAGSSPFAGGGGARAADPFARQAGSLREPSTAELEAENEAITRNAPIKRQTFKLALGQLVLVGSFTLITAAMLGTCYLVYEMGGITLAYD